MTAVFLILTLILPVSLTAHLQPQRTTLAQFQELRWLSGAWRGSGGGYAAFFEEYRIVNDSTIQMRAFADSTFRAATDSSTIEWRNGMVFNRGSGARSIAVEVRPGSIHFMREGASRGGFTFARVSADQWTATLHPSTADGHETVYVMRRVRR
jgi:hypothetical protein